MIQTNLAESPLYIEESRELIERSFGYTSNNSFSTDFYPLFNPENFKNCHILIEDQKVIAHIGVKQRLIEGHKLNLYGGIALADSYRGKGLFKNLFNSLLNSYADCSLHLLWSDKLELYQKFGFYPAGELHEYPQFSSKHEFLIEKVEWKNFKEKNLYENSQEFRISRSKEDWKEIFQISSSELFLIKKENRAINYFVKNKGADLTDIVHEYGWIDLEQLSAMRNYGRVWTPQTLDTNKTLFSTVVKLGELAQFKKLVEMFSGIQINEVTDNSIKFEYEGNPSELSLSDFLTGLLGPSRFKELTATKHLFISGLDSI